MKVASGFRNILSLQKGLSMQTQNSKQYMKKT